MDGDARLLRVRNSCVSRLLRERDRDVRMNTKIVKHNRMIQPRKRRSNNNDDEFNTHTHTYCTELREEAEKKLLENIFASPKR